MTEGESKVVFRMESGSTLVRLGGIVAGGAAIGLGSTLLAAHLDGVGRLLVIALAASTLLAVLLELRRRLWLPLAVVCYLSNDGSVLHVRRTFRLHRSERLVPTQDVAGVEVGYLETTSTWAEVRLSLSRQRSLLLWSGPQEIEGDLESRARTLVKALQVDLGHRVISA